MKTWAYAPDEPEQLGGSLKLTAMVPIPLVIGGVVVPLQVTIRVTALIRQITRSDLRKLRECAKEIRKFCMWKLHLQLVDRRGETEGGDRSSP
jgi:hypothetical protein